MLGTLLPATTVVAEAFSDSGEADGLFPEEEALVAKAVDRRRREFATGRRCAHQALAGLGLPGTAVLSGPHREPLWPAGVVGSLTHCDGYRAAAVAHAYDLASLGIDAEPNESLPAQVLEAIALPAEVSRLPALGGTSPGICWDRLLFCAKEAVYKAWFPLAQRWLGFHDADVMIEPGAGIFTATLLVPGPEYGGGTLTTMTGRFAATAGLLVTAAVVPRPSQPPTRAETFELQQ